MHNHKQLTRIVVILLITIGVGIGIYASHHTAFATTIPFSSTSTFKSQLILQPYTTQFTPADLIKARHIIEQRLQRTSMYGSFEVTAHQTYLEVNLSEGRDLPYITQLLTSVGNIQFIDGGKTPLIGQHLTDADLTNKLLFSNRNIRQFNAPSKGDMFYQLTLLPKTAANVERYLQTQPNTYVCIAVDGLVTNCSSLYHWADDTLEFIPNRGDIGVLQSQDLLTLVYSPPLPMPLKIIEQ